jgi:hypothetical protein
MRNLSIVRVEVRVNAVFGGKEGEVESSAATLRLLPLAGKIVALDPPLKFEARPPVPVYPLSEIAIG